MKGIVVTTDLEIRIEEFSDPLYKTVGSAVGGYIEHVKPARLRHPYCMIVNEEGLLLDLPLNYVGSYFYGTDQHGEPLFSLRDGVPPRLVARHYAEIGTGYIEGKKFIHYRALKGTSEYTSAEMAVFLDGIISECEELGIKTDSPDRSKEAKKP